MVRPKSLANTYMELLPALRRRLARLFANPADVEDVLQETFVRTSRVDVGEIKSLKAYLFRTARNIALNELNRKSRTITSYIDDVCGGEVPAGAVPVDQQVSDRLQMEAFGHAISSLPTQCRRVFLLSKLYGLKQKEIAKHLKISQSTVEKHMAKGILKCREYMREQGYDGYNMRLVAADDSKIPTERAP